MRVKKNRFFHCFKPLKLMIGLVVLFCTMACGNGWAGSASDTGAGQEAAASAGTAQSQGGDGKPKVEPIKIDKDVSLGKKVELKQVELAKTESGESGTAGPKAENKGVAGKKVSTGGKSAGKGKGNQGSLGGELAAAETEAEVAAEGEDTVETGENNETNADAEAKAEADAEAEAAYEEAKEKYNKAKENEQSTANKMLGAVGMGATGVGGAMLMSGLAEQNADADAERAMKAYLATFTCKFGNTSVQGGEKEVVIPGGNELIGLYGEYVALANDLKIRKTALGMKPGIESEPILESATSGLYDDVSTGKTSGAYASLARALMDPNGEDAKKWNEQRDKTQENIKTGGITAASGAGISLVGDITNKAVEKKKAEAAEKKAKEEADKKASAS